MTQYQAIHGPPGTEFYEVRSDKDLPTCPFCDWNYEGNTRRCYLKPSEKTCLLCLLGTIADHLSVLTALIEDLKTSRRW